MCLSRDSEAIGSAFLILNQGIIMLDLPPPNPPAETAPPTHLEQVVVHTEEDTSLLPQEESSVETKTSESTDSRDVVTNDDSTAPPTLSEQVVVHTEEDTSLPPQEESSVETKTSESTDSRDLLTNDDSTDSAHLELVEAPSDDDLLARAKELKAVFDDGFQWSDLASIVRQSYDFVVKYQDLSEERRQDAVIGIISHLIDITDTPYLPDRFTDPLFKAMVPPFVELFGNSIAGNFEKLPTPESEKPTGEDLIEFAQKLKSTFEDGFQWTDLATVVNSSMQFIGSFPFLPKEEKKDCVIEIVNHLIDITDTPKLPDNFIDPIFKSVVPSFVEILFEKAF